MSAQFLDDAARTAFERAIASIEATSSIEVVIALRQRSARYLHANVIVGGGVALAALATMLFVSHPFGLLAILFDPFIVGVAAAIVTEWLPDVKRLLTPASVRHRHVERAARATFVERGVHDTIDRSGMLVYISWLEGEIAIVPDTGLAAAFPPATLARIDAQLTSAMRRGGAAVAAALEQITAACATAMPRRLDDVNELPDTVDSDLAGGRS